MKRILGLVLIIAVFSMVFVPPANAATQAQIDAATTKGVKWLASQQLTAGCPLPTGDTQGGCWSPTDYPVGTTALAVWKLEVHAVLMGLSPFDPAYAYTTNVVNGLNYLFNNTVKPTASSVYFIDPWDSPVTDDSSYNTALALIAIVSGTEPNRVVNVAGSPVMGMTYHDVAVDAVNLLASAQYSAGTYVGGWDYDLTAAPNIRADNSITGHVVMGLLFAEAPLVSPPQIGGFGLTIPATVKPLLNTWITYIQNTSGGSDDGGSGYTSPGYWVNIYKTGHLLQEMAFVGDTSATARVQRAVAYLVRHWNDANQDPGWKGSAGGASEYLATLMVMKGLVALGINTIGGIDWFNDIADALLAQQNADGSWPKDDPAQGWSDSTLIRSTAWALLTLEKAVPPSSIVPVIPEYPLGLPLLAIFMLAGYGLIRRRATNPKDI